MENQHSSRHETTAFVTERETAKLTEMLTIAVGDLERISGGCGCFECCSIRPRPPHPGLPNIK
jgi:hypothetical protein